MSIADRIRYCQGICIRVVFSYLLFFLSILSIYSLAIFFKSLSSHSFIKFLEALVRPLGVLVMEMQSSLFTSD